MLHSFSYDVRPGGQNSGGGSLKNASSLDLLAPVCAGAVKVACT